MGMLVTGKACQRFLDILVPCAPPFWILTCGCGPGCRLDAWLCASVLLLQCRVVAGVSQRSNRMVLSPQHEDSPA